MGTTRRSVALVALALLAGVVLHFLPPTPSRQPETARATDLPSSAAVLARYYLDEAHAAQHELPKSLAEVSGLALTSDDRLLAHNDERGLIREVDPSSGEVRNTFAIVADGEPVAADFEGIAVLEDRVYLATSDGVIYECPEGTDGDNVVCETFTTGVGAEYELESLGTDAERRELILVSKNPRSDALAGLVCIDRWSAERKQLVEGGRVTVPFADLTLQLDDDRFQPSGVARDPATGHYLILAARQRGLAEVTADGRVLAVAALSKRLHRQPEGIAFGADGSLIIADEGEGKGGVGRLTVYPRRETQPPPAPQP